MDNPALYQSKLTTPEDAVTTIGSCANYLDGHGTALSRRLYSDL